MRMYLQSKASRRCLLYIFTTIFTEAMEPCETESRFWKMEKRGKSTLVEYLVETFSYPFRLPSRSFFFGEEPQQEF
jgi:hypothetical protein